MRPRISIRGSVPSEIRTQKLCQKKKKCAHCGFLHTDPKLGVEHENNIYFEDFSDTLKRRNFFSFWPIFSQVSGPQKWKNGKTKNARPNFLSICNDWINHKLLCWPGVGAHYVIARTLAVGAPKAGQLHSEHTYPVKIGAHGFFYQCIWIKD